jgi:4-amino-4-deoxy-L-arabinose transferase-like glycosyltransferase
MKRFHGPGKATPWVILALALAIRFLTASLLRQPGYTDAYYYAVGARQLNAGEGFTEPFIWNWLNQPEQVSHPGYLYWMPLTAIVGWLGLAAFGDPFWAVQAPFVLLSALLPLVAYGLALDLTGQRRHAVVAGLLAVFPGFYAHVLVLPDSFAPFALAGSLCLWAAGRGLRAQGEGRGRPALWFSLAGLAAGLGHLARADGPLLLGVALLAPLIGPGRRRNMGPRLLSLACCLLGYLLVMGPWFVRNWQVAGSPLPGAGLRTLFLTAYDDMFTYGLPLTLERYLAWGWGPILQNKIQALAVNLGRLWAENFLVVLLPFSALGLRKLSRGQERALLWPFLLYLPLLFLVMTLAFPFAGMRGGLFHSAGALLPTVFAVAGPGLEAALGWASRHLRGWHAEHAWPVFATSLVAMAALVTAYVLWQSGALSGQWNERNRGHAAIGQWLEAEGAAAATVMVGDAPAFTWHTGQPAIAVPNNPLETIVVVADRYGAGYLVLDGARPRTTDPLYAGREQHPRLTLVRTVGGAQLYEIAPP